MQNKNIGGTHDRGQENKSENTVQDDFDSRVKALLTQAEITPSQDLFEQIEQKLHTQPTFWQRKRTGKQSGFMYGFPAAAVVVLAILGGLFWKFYVTVPGGSPIQENAGPLVAISPAHDDVRQKTTINQSVRKEGVQQIVAAATKATPSIQRSSNNGGATANKQAKESQRNPGLVPDKVPAPLAAQRLAHSSAPQPERRNDLRPSTPKASGQNQDNTLDQSRVASVEQKHINHADEMVGQLKEARAAASLSTETDVAKSKAVAALQVPAGEISQKYNKTIDKAIASTVTEGANKTLLSDEDNSVQGRVAATRSRTKKGFFKGIFTHVKERVTEISESVVDEQPGKTTYNLGFVAVTAYK